MLKSLAAPLIILVLALGVVVPIFNLVQDQLLEYHMEQFSVQNPVEPVEVDYSVCKANHPDSYRYLMNHPKGTLRLCINALSTRPQDDDALRTLYRQLGNESLTALGLEPIENTEQWIDQFKAKQSDLYAAFSKDE